MSSWIVDAPRHLYTIMLAAVVDFHLNALLVRAWKNLTKQDSELISYPTQVKTISYIQSLQMYISSTSRSCISGNYLFRAVVIVITLNHLKKKKKVMT